MVMAGNGPHVAKESRIIHMWRGVAGGQGHRSPKKGTQREEGSALLVLELGGGGGPSAPFVL